MNKSINSKNFAQKPMKGGKPAYAQRKIASEIEKNIFLLDRKAKSLRLVSLSKFLYILKPNIIEKRLKDKIIYTIMKNEKIEIFSIPHDTKINSINPALLTQPYAINLFNFT